MNYSPKQKALLSEAIIDAMQKYRDCHKLLEKDTDKIKCTELIQEFGKIKAMVNGFYTPRTHED